VLIGAGAKILGPVTIGRESKIAANAVVISSAPAYSTLVGIPAKIIEGEAVRHDIVELDHAHLPDPVARAITNLVDNLNRLSVRVTEVEERQDCLEDKVVGEPSEPVRPIVKDRS